MFDFLNITVEPSKGTIQIRPDYNVIRSKDLMIRGGDFYAIWDEEIGQWSTDEDDAIRLIDASIKRYFEENKDKISAQYGGALVKPLYLRQARNKLINEWKHYVKEQMLDNYHHLDSQLTFANTKSKKTDYSSKRLKYNLEDIPTPAFNELLSVLYSPEEQHKIRWSIGAVVTGDSKHIQKFVVFYGSGGTGKSTILGIIERMFEGYCCSFNAKVLTSGSSAFPLEQFRTNPLVAVQHDGDLSNIKDNSIMNSLVSHEEMQMNIKRQSTFPMKFHSMLFMGSNSVVKITDAKSGIIRRLIDISPTGDRIPTKRYNELMKQIEFEFGGIAYSCAKVYNEDPTYYNSYIPTVMLGATNDFYNFMLNQYEEYSTADGVTLKSAWVKWAEYCDFANVPHKGSYKEFRQELKDYFDEYYDRYTLDDEAHTRVWSYYRGFRFDKFENKPKVTVMEKPDNKLNLKLQASIFDELYANTPAQYANEDEHPYSKWENVTTTLKDLDTTKLHYVNLPDNVVIVDFDRKDETGKKNYILNEQEALRWPPTYTELSKGGEGIHLHYIYNGDPSELASLYDENIEIKKMTGGSSLRRRLTKCNDLPLATLSRGDLPLKEKKMVNTGAAKDSEHLKNRILYAIKNKTGGGTVTAIQYIYDELEKAYSGGMEYDVSELKDFVYQFAICSTNHSKECRKMVHQMKFKSETITPGLYSELKDATPVFWDLEVTKNHFVCCWKPLDLPGVKWLDPTPEQMEWFITNPKFLLAGFNSRKYDDHIAYARAYEREDFMQLFKRSTNIVNNVGKPFFGPAYGTSWLDLYDVASKKQSLKKWEIELKLKHQEFPLKWDQPVPDEMLDLLMEYCMNDVEATEALYKHLASDIEARKILADIAEMPVSTPTNTLTTKIIFGGNKNPQTQFCYRNLANPIFLSDEEKKLYSTRLPIGFTAWDGTKSDLPCFPGYLYENGSSTYRGFEVGEGGFVFARPGMYRKVITFDVASMHPHSVTTENLFGAYTKQFEDLMELRVAIKHEDYERAKNMLGGKVAKYLTDKKAAKGLSKALKLAINSVYGLTAAKFENPFRDTRNADNIVAKRGALFMIDLKHAVEERGGKVVHIKTDSIKLEDPSDELCEFVMNFGKTYGYAFEIEHKFEKICLVNDAVYIAKLSEDDPEEPGQWTATGAEFAHPFIFKTLFTKEEVTFDDLCETKAVTSALYLDMNEEMPEDEHNYKFVGKVGSFCPILPGRGGGLLMREKDDKYSAATGTKGYRWMEAEDIKNLGKEGDIDMSYYMNLANSAADHIREFGDFEWFAA